MAYQKYYKNKKYQDNDTPNKRERTKWGQVIKNQELMNKGIN